MAASPFAKRSLQTVTPRARYQAAGGARGWNATADCFPPKKAAVPLAANRRASAGTGRSGGVATTMA